MWSWRKYGNLFHMYQKITDSDPTKEPMAIYPAVHYTMGGLWVDYHLMTTVPGLYATGECNFSDHGANRLGASASCRSWPTATSSCPTPSATTWPPCRRYPTNTNDLPSRPPPRLGTRPPRPLKNTKEGKAGQTVDHPTRNSARSCGRLRHARNKAGLSMR